MFLYKGLEKKTKKLFNSQEIFLIKEAYLFAKEAHKNQKRSSGEAYITHPVAVAEILLDMKLDSQSIIAALLHDVIEDTKITRDDIAEKFGPTIADLVEALSKLDRLKFTSKEEAQAQNFQKMIMAMVLDIRVILIKLADRLHNMQTIRHLAIEKRKRIAKETLEIYAPIANRLGIHNIKNALEDLGFITFYPFRYKVLENAIAKFQKSKLKIKQKILSDIETALNSYQIRALVKGREKNIYSIFCKMRHKKKSFDKVIDLFGFRIILYDHEMCYRVLGIIHNLYKPKPGRFKDYIALPKANGYQSLHTSLMGPAGAPVEIQIRTTSMDTMANIGIASHSSYKETQNHLGKFRPFAWMQTLLDIKQSAGNTLEFIENVKTDLFGDEIYVFTPLGKIIELPDGSTPIDFAYAIHTDVGNTCIGVKINGSISSLGKKLENGEVVNIICAKYSKPNASWLNFVVTTRARNKIRHELRELNFTEAINLGKKLLDYALMPKSIDDLNLKNIAKVVEFFKQKDLNNLLAQIGFGEILSFIVAKKLQGEIDTNSFSKTDKFSIKGSAGILINYGKCCYPILGDNIIALAHPGKGLVIHREACHNFISNTKNHENILKVSWDLNLKNKYFASLLLLDIKNSQGSLAKVTSIVANMNISIIELKSMDIDNIYYRLDLTISIKSRVHLAQVIKALHNFEDVIAIKRKI